MIVRCPIAFVLACLGAEIYGHRMQQMGLHDVRGEQSDHPANRSKLSAQLDGIGFRRPLRALANIFLATHSVLGARRYHRNRPENIAHVSALVTRPFLHSGSSIMQLEDPKLPHNRNKVKKDSLSSSIRRLGSAARRMSALACIDASIARPRLKPLTDKMLNALKLRASNGKSFLYYRKSEQASVLLILAHPSNQQSLCSSLADIWEESLIQNGIDVERLDLNGADQFGLNNASELRASVRAELPTPSRNEEFQRLVEKHQFLVFVHPVFWFETPCQLKGFLESVMSSGFAYRMLPNHWVLNFGASVLQRLPGIKKLFRRYLAYGLLRDKRVYVTRTHGGTPAGMGVYGHAATSLESSLQFCGARLLAVDRVGFVHSSTPESIREKVLPKARRRIASHSRAIAAKIKRSPLRSQPS